MNYERIYNQLIANAQTATRQKGGDIYYEQHHIIPRCMQGSNNKDNLVLLTGREHFIAHLLLHKMYPDNVKLLYAINCMCNNWGSKRQVFVNGRIYENIKQKISKQVSKQNKGRKLTPEQCLKLSQSLKQAYKSGKVQPTCLKGVRNGMYGKTRPDYVKRAVSEANKRRVWTPEMRSKTGRRGKDNHQYGKPITDEMKFKRRLSICHKIMQNYPTNVIDLYYWDNFAQRASLNIQTVLRYFETFENVISYVNEVYNKNYICKNVNPVLFKFLQQQKTNIPALFTNKYNTRILKRKINSYYIAFIQDHIYDKNLCNDFCDFVNAYYINIRNKYTDIKSVPFDNLFKDYSKLVRMYCEQKPILNCQRISLYNSIDEFLSISLSSIIR